MVTMKSIQSILYIKRVYKTEKDGKRGGTESLACFLSQLHYTEV